MVVKIYISGISGNKEVKKRQQRVLMILDSKNVEYQIIDITEPGKEDEKEFMQANSTARDSKHPLPPQIFNNDDYCGDYEDFDLANELDQLEKFLKPILNSPAEPADDMDNSESNNVRQNRNSLSRETSTDKDASVVHSESQMINRRNSMTETDNDDEILDKSNSEDVDKTTKSQVDGDYETDELEDKNEEKSDEQEKEE